MEIFAHRARGFGFTDNSLEALEECSKEGFFYEIDLRELFTGEIVVQHDSTIDGMSVSTLQKQSFIGVQQAKGKQPLFLDDALSLMEKYPQAKGLWELKISSPSLLANVEHAIAAAHLNERVTVIGFPMHRDGLSALAKKGIKTGLIDTWPLAMVSHVKRYGVSLVLSGGTNALTRALFFSLVPFLGLKQQIKTLHAHDKKFIAGVINSKWQAHKLFRLGCDGIVTDNPRAIQGYLEK